MAKNDSVQPDNSWDSGTYQTGAAKPGKGQSGLVTGLLIATIFLGGLASALGLMNIRLLTQLTNQQNSVLPLSVKDPSDISGSAREQQNQLPQLPQDRRLELTVGGNTQPLSPEQILAQPSMLRLTVETNRGRVRSCSAVVLSSQGYLLTNAHLTNNARAITVELPDGESVGAILVAADVYADLAVLYIQAENLTAAVFSDEAVAAGDPVYSPVQCDAMSLGSLLPEFRQLQVGSTALQLQKTDFDIDHGPAFDGRGRLIGFLCRYFGQDGEGKLLSAAQVADIATQLVQQGSVSSRPSLGLQVQELSSFFLQYWKLSGGLEITALSQQAEAAGLMQGDILLRVNGSLLTDSKDFYEVLLYTQPEQQLALEVFRAGQRFTVQLPVQWLP